MLEARDDVLIRRHRGFCLERIHHPCRFDCKRSRLLARNRPDSVDLALCELGKVDLARFVLAERTDA